jgi:hypothetical protein
MFSAIKQFGKTSFKAVQYTVGRHYKKVLFSSALLSVSSIFAVRQFVKVQDFNKNNQKMKWHYSEDEIKASKISLPDNGSIVHVETEKADYYVVGGVHYGSESANQVINTLQALKPQVVMVELCSERFNSGQMLMNWQGLISAKDTGKWASKMSEYGHSGIIPRCHEMVRTWISCTTTPYENENCYKSGRLRLKELINKEYFQGVEMASAIQYALNPANKSLLILGDRDINQTETDYNGLLQYFQEDSAKYKIMLKDELDQLAKFYDDSFLRNHFPTLTRCFLNDLISSIVVWFGTKEQRKTLYSSSNYRILAEKENSIQKLYDPGFTTSLVALRDDYMCNVLVQDIPVLLQYDKIQAKENGDINAQRELAQKPIIVAVVGMAHLDGMERFLQAWKTAEEKIATEKKVQQ